MKMRYAIGLLALLGLPLVATGCKEEKKEILDLKTPEGGVTIEQDEETGEVDIEVRDGEN